MKVSSPVRCEVECEYIEGVRVQEMIDSIHVELITREIPDRQSERLIFTFCNRSAEMIPIILATIKGANQKLGYL